MLAREGLVPVAVSTCAAAGLLLQAMWWPGAIAVALVMLLCWAYWEAASATAAAPLAAVSPVAGRVRSVAVKRDPWLQGRDSLRVVLRVGFPGFRTLRAPLEGKVMDFWVRGGQQRDDPTGNGSPTCYTLWVQTDEGDDLVVAVHGRRVISRFRARVSPGERIGHGHKLGYIYFCTAVTLYLPADADPGAEAGCRVVGGGTVLGTLPRRVGGAAT